MSLFAKAFVMSEVSRKLFVVRPIGEFHDLIYGTTSSPKILLYSSEPSGYVAPSGILTFFLIGSSGETCSVIICGITSVEVEFSLST